MAFPPASISVTFGTSPTLIYALQDFRDESDPTFVLDVTDYEFELVVRDADGADLFRLAGTIVTAAEGTFKFELTEAHTGYAPGTYDAEIRWWFDPGVAPFGRPLDSVPVSYTVNAGSGPGE